MLGKKTILGLTIDEAGILVAELRAGGGEAEPLRTAEFPLEEPLSADNAVEVGRRLRSFLKENGFASRRAAVGLPAKWTVARELVVPPATADSLAGILQIQAERAFSFHAGELVYDYCGQADPSDRRRVLLVATRRRIVDQVEAMLSAAGLQVRSMTVSALALAGSARDECGLRIRPGYCEIWSREGNCPRSLRHVPLALNGQAPQAKAVQLASEVRRSVLLAAGRNAATGRRISIYDASGASGEMVEQLRDSLAPHVEVTHEDSQEHSAAVAVAATREPAVDFVNPRLGRKKAKTHGRAIGWAAFIGLVVVVAVVASIVGWRADRAAIATYRRQLTDMEEDLTAARELIDHVSYASGWASQQPQFLPCLRELTLAFPEEPTVWATNLGLQENAEGLLVGRAVDEASVMRVLDAIKDNGAFSAVQMVYMRDAGRDSREISFAVKFAFEPGK